MGAPRQGKTSKAVAKSGLYELFQSCYNLAGPTMNPQTIKAYLLRWKRVTQLQGQELRKLSINEKFRQLDAMLRLALGMKIDFNKNRDQRSVRARWILLKEKFSS